MILVTSSSSDTYITDKIIDSSRAVSGNVGRAGTLDLFKLYDESTAITSSIELSRLLIKFDLSKALTLSSSTLDVNDASFNAKLRLCNLSTGQPVPNNFTVQIFPLAVSFSEGFGRDVISFADVDAANFLSSSAGALWNVSGAFKSGTLGDSSIDYYASGNLLDGNGVVNLGATQTFAVGTEDLVVDVTRVVSATIAGILPNHGFRISFIDSEETDSTTRFVKRFASRHVREQSLRPSLVLSCDDSIVDNHSSSYFDVTSSLFLHNIVRGSYQNLVSGSSLTQVTGSNCCIVKFTSGSYTKYVTGSQLSLASPITGVYSASVAFYSSDSSVVSGTTTLKQYLAASGSITFDEVWTSLDGTVAFYSGSLVMKAQGRSTAAGGNRKIRVSTLSTPTSAIKGQEIRIRAAFYDDYDQNKSSKFSYDPIPLQVSDCRLRLRDTISGKLVFDYDVLGSRMSADTVSNYFTLQTECLPIGVPLAIEFKMLSGGETLEVTSKNFRLVVSE
jgi:hypothetical protein